MARGYDDETDNDALSASVIERFGDVPWNLFNSDDLASSGETRFGVSRIQSDLMKVAAIDPPLAGRIWDEHVPGFVPRPAGLPEPERPPENGIEPGGRRKRSQPEAFLDAYPAKTSDRENEPAAAPGPGGRDGWNKDGKSQGAPAPEQPDPARVRLLMAGLDKQYLKADEKYHFRDKAGAVAFEAHDKRLLTQHDTPTVVNSMIDLAEARGWSSLKLTGTKEFRREAWLQASLRDIPVSGYQPEKLDRARLDELRAERASGKAPNVMVEGPAAPEWTLKKTVPFDPVNEDGKAEARIPLTPTQDQFLRVMEATMRHRGDSPQAIDKARELANERLTSDRIHVGTLINAGTAPYLDKPGEKASHYVTLRDKQGQETKVWGVDLPRALAESGAKEGQTIAVAFKGRQSVSVDVPVRDAAGKTVRTERQTVDRNSWEVVPFDRLRQEAKAAVLQAVQRQERPAELKVFDRSASPAGPRYSLKPRENKTRERTR